MNLHIVFRGTTVRPEIFEIIDYVNGLIVDSKIVEMLAGLLRLILDLLCQLRFLMSQVVSGHVSNRFRVERYRRRMQSQ